MPMDRLIELLPQLWDATLETLFVATARSEEHTSELQSQSNLVCRLLLEKKNHQRRRRRLSPRRLPRGHGQDPLPPAPGLYDLGPATAGDPHPTRAPARLLPAADHHRPA